MPPSDPIKRCLALMEEVAVTLRTIGVPVPRPEYQKNNRPKLTRREVDAIREMHRSKVGNQREIAEAFDVNPATISRIVRGQYHR